MLAAHRLLTFRSRLKAECLQSTPFYATDDYGVWEPCIRSKKGTRPMNSAATLPHAG
jgi:hypothetical protein